MELEGRTRRGQPHTAIAQPCFGPPQASNTTTIFASGYVIKYVKLNQWICTPVLHMYENYGKKTTSVYNNPFLYE